MRSLLERMICGLSAVILAAGAVSCSKPSEEEAPLTISLSAQNTDVEAPAGSIFLSVRCSAAWTLTADSPWVSLSQTSGSGNINSIILSYGENVSEEKRTATVTLRAGRASESLAIVQKGVTHVPETTGSPVAVFKWLELPATRADDGFDFYAHDNSGGSYKNQTVSGTRNWSFYYDYASTLSRWVAYPLNRGLIGSGSRTDAWGYDPLVPYDLQQAITNGAYGTGHSRGHQIPSADRLSFQQNVTTFYATNMTPQDYNFNGGIWANLESKVRSYASSSDTLYVVTGCVIDNESQALTDKAGRLVRIPSAYFKALLRYMPGSTVGYDGYMACGYYLPHTPSIARGNFLDYIMPIDSLETLTGFDFFVNLPDKVGKETADKIEAQEPASWWK